MTAAARLAALGLVLPPVAGPVGSYVPARASGDLVFSSGQLPFIDGALLALGLVGDDAAVPPALAAECARACALNAIAAIASAAGGIEAIAGIVKVTVFVASSSGFSAQPAVANGASDLMVEVFGEAGRHARSAVGVAALPLGAPVEVEVVATVR